MSNLREQHFNHVEQTFSGCFDMMLGKSHDYAEEDNPYSNFEFAAEVAKITVEQGLLFMKGIKLARLRELLLSDKEPANESEGDTCDDDINYTAILKSFRAFKTGPVEPLGGEVTNDFDQDLDYFDGEEEDFAQAEETAAPTSVPVYLGPDWIQKLFHLNHTEKV